MAERLAAATTTATTTDPRSLDAQIAEYFFGWSEFELESGILTGINPRNGFRNNLFSHFSTNGSDMLELIEKLNTLGWWVHLRSPTDRNRPDTWRAVCSKGGEPQYIRDAETGPEAVARVVLAAIGVDA